MLKEELQDTLGCVVSQELYEKLNEYYEFSSWNNNVEFRDYLIKDPATSALIDEIRRLREERKIILDADDVVAKTIIEAADHLYGDENLYNLLDYCADKLMRYIDKIWYKLEKGYRLSPEEIEYIKNHIHN